jgi:hypothetical protein
MNAAFEPERGRMLAIIDDIRADFNKMLKAIERLTPIHQREQLEARLKARIDQPVNQVTKLLR